MELWQIDSRFLRNLAIYQASANQTNHRMKRSNKVPTNSQTKASQYNHERDHLLWLVYDRARLPFASPTIVTITDPYYWRAYYLYGKSGNSGRIQMEPFIPVEFLRKKVTRSRFYRNDRFCTTCLFTSARLPLERKRKIYQYFVHGTALRREKKEKKIPLQFNGKFLPKFSYK